MASRIRQRRGGIGSQIHQNASLGLRNRRSATRRRGRIAFRFSLGTLLVAVILVAAMLAIRQGLVRPYQDRLRHERVLAEAGARIVSEPQSPAWLGVLVGPEAYHRVVEIDFSAIDEQSGTPPGGAAAPSTGSRTPASPLVGAPTAPSSPNEIAVRTLTPTIWLAIRSFRDVRRLNLTRTDTGDADLIHVGVLTELETLDLADTRVTDVGVASAAMLPKLRALRLPAGVAGSKSDPCSGLDALADHPALEGLDLELTDLRDRHLAALRKIPRLKALVAPPKMTDAAMHHIAACPGVEWLDLTPALDPWTSPYEVTAPLSWRVTTAGLAMLREGQLTELHTAHWRDAAQTGLRRPGLPQPSSSPNRPSPVVDPPPMDHWNTAPFVPEVVGQPYASTIARQHRLERLRLSSWQEMNESLIAVLPRFDRLRHLHMPAFVERDPLPRLRDLLARPNIDRVHYDHVVPHDFESDKLVLPPGGRLAPGVALRTDDGFSLRLQPRVSLRSEASGEAGDEAVIPVFSGPRDVRPPHLTRDVIWAEIQSPRTGALRGEPVGPAPSEVEWLTRLRIDRGQIDGAWIRENLGPLNLKTLVLWGCDLTPDAADALRELTTLEMLVLHELRFDEAPLTRATVDRVLDRLDIKELQLSGDLTDDDVLALATRPGLEYLWVASDRIRPPLLHDLRAVETSTLQGVGLTALWSHPDLTPLNPTPWEGTAEELAPRIAGRRLIQGRVIESPHSLVRLRLTPSEKTEGTFQARLVPRRGASSSAVYEPDCQQAGQASAILLDETGAAIVWQGRLGRWRDPIKFPEYYRQIELSDLWTIHTNPVAVSPERRAFDASVIDWIVKPEMRKLILGANSLTKDGAEAIARHPGLEQLHLYDMAMSEAAFARLQSRPWRHVTVSNITLHEHALHPQRDADWSIWSRHPLAPSPHPARWKTKSLHNSVRLIWTGSSAVADIPKTRYASTDELRTLELHPTIEEYVHAGALRDPVPRQTGEPSVLAFTRTTPHLRRLRLPGVILTSEDVAELVGNCPCLETLDCDDVNLTDADRTALERLPCFEAINPPPL